MYAPSWKGCELSRETQIMNSIMCFLGGRGVPSDPAKNYQLEKIQTE